MREIVAGVASWTAAAVAPPGTAAVDPLLQQPVPPHFTATAASAANTTAPETMLRQMQVARCLARALAASPPLPPPA